MTRKTSLKTKITLQVLIVNFCLSLLTAAVAGILFTDWHKKNVEGQQVMLVSRIAEELDDKIQSAQQALILGARQISADLVAAPELATHELRDHVVIESIFDSGIFLFTPEGRIITETARKPPRTGLDLSHREYITRTRLTGQPYISAPFVSIASRKPVIMFTAPVHGPDGRLVAILGGSIDLQKANFLGKLARTRIGATGHFFLFSRDRMMIMHPDPAMIMKRGFSPGANHLFDGAVAGEENSGETSNLQGIRSVQTFRQLRSVNWVLAADQPVDEVYAPIRKVMRFALLVALLGGVITALIMWLLMSRLTAPILSLTEQIRKLQGGDSSRQVSIHSRDEVEELAETFNGLMELVRRKEEELYYLSVHDSLTRLYNRSYFEAELKRLARGRTFPVGIIMADLDGLKTVNDSHGHGAGDRLLRSAALILQKGFRRGDVVARIGGDEFSVLMAGVDADEVEEALQRVRKLVEAHNRKVGKVHVGLSLGGATALNGDVLDEALVMADQRMYADKALKRSALLQL